MEQRFHDFYRGKLYYADLDPVFGHEQAGPARCWYSRMMWATTIPPR